MKRMFVLVCAVAVSGAAASAAGTWKNRAYDATYSMTDRQGAGTYRLAADGRGKALVETVHPGSSSLMIMDNNTKTCYSISVMPDGRKQGMKMPLTEESGPVNTAEHMRQMNARPLGVKVIGGHPCHGWQYTVANSMNQESWIADDIDFMVSANSTNPATGSMQMTLKSFSPVGPAATAFNIPSDVKMMDISAIRNMYGGQ